MLQEQIQFYQQLHLLVVAPVYMVAQAQVIQKCLEVQVEVKGHIHQEQEQVIHLLQVPLKVIPVGVVQVEALVLEPVVAEVQVQQALVEAQAHPHQAQ